MRNPSSVITPWPQITHNEDLYLSPNFTWYSLDSHSHVCRAIRAVNAREPFARPGNLFGRIHDGFDELRLLLVHSMIAASDVSVFNLVIDRTPEVDLELVVDGEPEVRNTSFGAQDGSVGGGRHVSAYYAEDILRRGMNKILDVEAIGGTKLVGAEYEFDCFAADAEITAFFAVGEDLA